MMELVLKTTMTVNTIMAIIGTNVMISLWMTTTMVM